MTIGNAVSRTDMSAKHCLANGPYEFPDRRGLATPHLVRKAAPLPLTRAEQKAVRAFAFATEEFEPYPKFMMAASILQSLIEKGLVECGPSIRPAVDATGFRLTEMGCRILRQVW